MPSTGSAVRSIPVQIARNFAAWAVGVPAIYIVLSPIGETPLPDAAGWTRLALLGLPLIFASALIETFAERGSTVWRRAYGRGLAITLVMFVLASADRIAAGVDALRVARGLAIVPIMALFWAVAMWTRETYLTPVEPTVEPTAASQP